MAPDAPLSIFLSYSHLDEGLRERLEKHLSLLRREGRIALWHDRKIRGGEDWAERISDHLETADLMLLLVSADFLASDYCYEKEMRRALERHDAGVARAVPVVLKPCDWQSAPFGRLQALPRDDRPVTAWEDPEAAWTEVARELRALVDELRESRGGKPPPEPEPRFPNERIRGWSRQLREAYVRLEEQTVAGGEVAAVEAEIDGLRRRLREGGLAAGDCLARGRFQLIAEIGTGGFATVWKAYDRKRRETVAVKVLHAQYARDASRRERFFRGAREMAELQHPGIVRVIEEQERDGRFHFFVMELMDDGDLHRAVLAGRFPELADRLRLVREVGDALSHAHERGVVHRDVKPHNVLIDAAGRARLTDFDLVRAADSVARTRTGSMLGTWGYAAPEVMFNAKEATAASDVYGLGMTAVFAIHGEDLPPKVVLDAPGFAAELEVGAPVRGALERAVAFEPEERFASVEELCRELSESLTRPEPPEPPKQKVPKRKRPAPRTSRKRRPAPAPPSAEELFQWVETPLDGRVSLWCDIPSGTFEMGSPEGEGDRDEHPLHHVTIQSGFRIGAVPVTNARFAAFDPQHEPYAWKGVSPAELAYHPAVNVSWHTAAASKRVTDLDLTSRSLR